MKIKYRPCSSSKFPIDSQVVNQPKHILLRFVYHLCFLRDSHYLLFEAYHQQKLLQLNGLIPPPSKQEKGSWGSYFMIPQAPFGLQPACCTSLLLAPQGRKSHYSCAASQAPAMLASLPAPHLPFAFPDAWALLAAALPCSITLCEVWLMPLW